MKNQGDLIDRIIDIFRNTKAADRAMYIASVIGALLRKGRKDG